LKSIDLHLCVNETSISAVDFISQQSTFSKNLIKKIMSSGAVWLSRNKTTQRIRRVTKKLIINDQIHIYYNEEIINQKPQSCLLIADEGEYSVWNKPAGIFSQGTRYGDHCTVQRFSEKHLQPQRNAFIVHRLDRAANGLILLAHSKKAAALLSALFQKREINKTYQIVVEGHLQIEQFPYSIKTPIDGKHASSTIEKANYLTEFNQTKVQVSIQTGRKHQIRKHMASLGHPVVGDNLYGNNVQSTNNNIKLELKAWKLEFNSPLNQQHKIYQLAID
jgi:tRNA pseudouridine32 synthase / 23S rRNA pseudouridine746 synthase